MAFPRRLLNDDEDVVLELRPHWWFLSAPMVALLVCLAAAVAIQIATRPPDPVTLASIVAILVALAWFSIRYVRWATTNLVLTTDRLIHRRGVLVKHGQEILLHHVNDISSRQTLLQRLVGVGDLTVESGGERGQQAFANVSRPFVVQNAIYRQIERARAREEDRRSMPRSWSIPDQLERLDELRRRGIITQAEFDAKRVKLLDQL